MIAKTLGAIFDPKVFAIKGNAGLGGTQEAFYSGGVVTWAIDRNNETAAIDAGDRAYDEYTNAGC